MSSNQYVPKSEIEQIGRNDSKRCFSLEVFCSCIVDIRLGFYCPFRREQNFLEAELFGCTNQAYILNIMRSMKKLWQSYIHFIMTEQS